MFNKISRWLNIISKNWVVLLTLFIMILFMFTVLPGQAASSEKEVASSNIPDTSFFYSPGDLFQMADDFGEEGRQAYIHSRWTFDLVFPLVYVSFLAAGISWFYQTLANSPERFALSNVLPILAGLFDYLENSGASLIMGLYPEQVPGLALLTSIFSAAKWLLIGLSFLGYFILAAAVFIQWIRTRKERN